MEEEKAIFEELTSAVPFTEKRIDELSEALGAEKEEVSSKSKGEKYEKLTDAGVSLLDFVLRGLAAGIFANNFGGSVSDYFGNRSAGSLQPASESKNSKIMILIYIILGLIIVALGAFIYKSFSGKGESKK